MTHLDQYTLKRIEVEEGLLKLQKKLESDFLRYEDLYIEELKEIRADIEDTEQRLAVLKEQNSKNKE